MRALAAIVLLTLVIDAAFLKHSHASIGLGETDKWWSISLSLAHGHGYSYCDQVYFPFCGPSNEVTATREPAPVLLFAAVAALTHDSLPAAISLELLMSLAIVPAIFLLTRRLADPRTALLAALLWSLYLAPAKLFLPDVTGDLLATLGVAWGMFFLVRAQQRDRAWDWVTAGACMGVGALSRSAVSVPALILTVGLLFRPPGPPTVRSLRARLRPVALFGLVFALTLAPWLARNYDVFGRLVLNTTLADYNLYRNNFPLRTEDYLRFVSGDEGTAAVVTLLERRTNLCGCENEAEMDAVYREEALRIIAEHPLRYLGLSAYRFVMLWFNWGVSAAYGGHDDWTDYALMFQHAFFLAMAVWGLACAWPRGWLLAASVIAMSLAYMAVIGRIRLIVPVMPLTIVLSAIACGRLVESIGRRLTHGSWIG